MKTISQETKSFLFDPHGLDPNHTEFPYQNFGENEFIEEFGALEQFLDIHFNPLSEPNREEKISTIGDANTIQKEEKALLKKLSSMESGGFDRIESGTLLANRFEVKEFLDSGGFGHVYKGYDRNLEIEVAIKISKKERISNPKIRKRFIREAKVMTGIKHPNVVRIYDVGEFGEDIYLVMELVDGVTLERFLRGQKEVTSAELKGLMIKISDALGAIHAQDIIHRDIKPANIMVDKGGNPIIMDFGLAREWMSEDGKSQTLTVKGNFVGSPAYMAPEQFIRPHDISKSSDVYSMGITFYQMATGELPIQGKSIGEFCNNHQNIKPQSIQEFNRDIPQKISTTIEKMLQKNPADRFSDANAVCEALKDSQKEIVNQPVTYSPQVKIGEHEKLPESAYENTGSNTLPSKWFTHRKFAATFMLFGMITLLFYLFYPESRKDKELEITIPSENSPLVCEITELGGRISLAGTSKGISKGKLEMLLFLNPSPKLAGSWFLQRSPYGIAPLSTDGKWKGSALCGNPKSLPIGDEVVSVALLVFDKTDSDWIRNRMNSSYEAFSELPVKKAKYSKILSEVAIRVPSDGFRDPQPRSFAVFPFGKDDQSEEYFSDKLTKILDTRVSELADRSQFRKADLEYELVEDGKVEPTTAVKVGKMMGVHIMITGKVTSYKGVNTVHVWAINVETGEMLGAVSLDPENLEGSVDQVLEMISTRLVYRSIITKAVEGAVFLKHGKLFGALERMKLRVLDEANATVAHLAIRSTNRNSAEAQILHGGEDIGRGFRVEELKQP